MSDKAGYRSIMKATSIFGGVQIIQIIIGIIKSKFIALLLGPSGMGISGLLLANTGLISSFTNFGLSTSAIKNISSAQLDNDPLKVGRIIAVFKRLLWMTGLFGTILTLALSPYLSHITFGNKEYTWAFAALSITLFANQMTLGQEVLLRSMRQIKLMANSAMIGSGLGLLTSIPLYYYLGIDGIVPALIVSAFTSLSLSLYFSSKLSFDKPKLNFIEIKSEGKEMLLTGFLISLSGIISMVFSYFIRIFINQYGSVDDVGLYNAGFIIINTYVGMIFTAMATDYYPRLSQVVNDVYKTNKAINQQAEIAILIIGPLLLILIVFMKWVILILYSESFLHIYKMLLFASAGMLFKAISWVIAFIFLAKSSGKFFFWNELFANCYVFGLNIVGYMFYGLTGLGFSFLAGYIIYTFQVLYVANRLFEYKLDKQLFKIFSINAFLLILCLIIVLNSESNLGYILGTTLIIISSFLSLYYLDKKLELRLDNFRKKR